MQAGQVNETPRHSVSVAAAIFDDAGEKILLIKRRDNGNWEPPGGVLELDETIEDGLRREVREETGAEIEIGQLTGIYKNMSRGIVALVFRCEITSEPRASSDEAAEIAWWDQERITGVVADVYAVRIADAAFSREHVGALPIRHHDGVELFTTPGDFDDI